MIGKGLGPQFEEPSRQIVGIVGNVRENGLGNAGVGVMYVPQSQMTEGLTALANSVIPLSWCIRTATDPSSLRVAIERELHGVDGQMPISRERTMTEVLAGAVARQSFNMVLLSIFAGVALVLAAIGIYGLMSYSVDQRRQEIGIRMALGADRGRMLRVVLREGMTLAVLGVVLGLLARLRPDASARESVVWCESERSVRLCRRRRHSDDGCPCRRVHPREAGDDRRSGHRPQVRMTRQCRLLHKPASAPWIAKRCATSRLRHDRTPRGPSETRGDPLAPAP